MPFHFPTLHLFKLPKLLVERRATAIFGVAILALIWCGIGIKYAQEIASDKNEATRTNRNFAMVFEENVLRSIGEIDKSLLYLRRTIETGQDTGDYHTIVNTADLLSEIIVQVAIIDDHGVMRASNIGPQPAREIDLSDREHFRVHLNSSEDKLFISQPVIGRASGRWSVQFTRRFVSRDGQFGGVVVASLNPAHLTAFYSSIDFGSSTSIALIGLDGVVRSSGGRHGSFELGQDLSHTDLFQRARSITNTSVTDVDPTAARLVTFRKVRGHPLFVSVSADYDEIFRGSRAELHLKLLVGLALSLIVLVAMERMLVSEAKARQKARQLQLTLENMSQGIMLVTPDRQVPVINSRCIDLLNLPAVFYVDQLLLGPIPNKPVRDVKPSKSDQSDVTAGNNPSSPQTRVFERLMPNGGTIEIRRRQLVDGSLVQTVTDITERRAAEASLVKLASEDPLTQLPNRRVFRDALERSFRDTHGQPAETAQFAILFLDVDRFKIINDTLGHRIGDMLLQAMAQRLKSLLPRSYLIARLGGDEFAIVAPHFTSFADLETKASRIVESLAQPYEINGHQIRSGASVGIAVGPRDGEGVDELLMAADLALYAVKADRRNAYKFYDPSMNSDLNERCELETQLRNAIEQNALALHYQPIIDLRRRVVSGFEALARWHHPEQGMISPAIFIPVAEDTGLINPMGEWVLLEACKQAAQWPDNLYVAVNLSPVQIVAPNLPDLVQRALLASGLAAHRLEIEITERTIMENTNRTLSNLRSLKEMGLRIALDDFGTGYSSLSYLRKFPFDKIKVDRSFISALTESTEQGVIVRAIVSIAAALGLTATAEGVEVELQREHLAALGYDEAQGYLFSAAVPIEGVPEIIAEWNKQGSIAA